MARAARPKVPGKVLPGPVFHEPSFNEGVSSLDPTGFMVDHPSDKDIYAEVDKLLKKNVVAFAKARGELDDVFLLETALGKRGKEVVKAISDAGRTVFHAIGDSGATKSGKAYGVELAVADQLTADCNTTEAANRPAFLLHLGDVVYDFGEPQYYYDQFYEPFRNYPAPIFAIAGNHDSFVVPGTPAGAGPLDVFARNFCATETVITPEAGSLHRTAMTQPGVYFALEAPRVRIICLFSNALEDPGLISSEGAKWPGVPNYQREFLAAQLERFQSDKFEGALLLAVHHPPFSYGPPSKKKSGGGNHGSSTQMLAEIDKICQKAGVYPHAFLSGHAHNYQRYTRTVKFAGNDYDVPFIVCGDGGHHVNTLVRPARGHTAEEPHFGTDVGYLDVKPSLDAHGLLLEKYNDHGFGYLRISVDKDNLAIGFHLVGQTSLAQSRFDKVTVDLKSHQMVSN